MEKEQKVICRNSPCCAAGYALILNQIWRLIAVVGRGMKATTVVLQEEFSAALAHARDQCQDDRPGFQ